MTSPFEKAILRFDQENSKDPNREENQPKELLYAKRLTDWVLKLSPQASEVLQLAARCQHLCRWMIPRSQYEMNRAGYLKWRSDLKKFHSEKAGEILKEIGYNSETIRKVQELNLKKNFPNDPESQVLEDALCLVFLEFQFQEFVEKNSADKVISILQKSWEKMSKQGQEEALKLSLGKEEENLIQRALSE
jgi:hypothetical protein